mmetsp:Transcript_16780/g.25216  ORF Transcript_16780/g.25216 Transcript_16780/m.25216 type:complete len:773 (+) Transcript_16780:69-2387(+)
MMSSEESVSEYVAYYESHIGHYMPIIAVYNEDGTKEFREMRRDDIMRIADGGGFTGGWLFKRGQSVRESWQKRYMIVRGSYIFYFHNPQNERPVGVIPLENCVAISPPGGGRSFTEQRLFRANEGFEFEIRHPSRRSVQLHAVSEEERDSWMKIVEERSGRVDGVPVQDSHSFLSRSAVTIIAKEVSRSAGSGMENVAVTPTRIPRNATMRSHRGDEKVGHTLSGMPFAPPPPPSQYGAGFGVMAEEREGLPPSTVPDGTGGEKRVRIEDAIRESQGKDEEVRRQGAAERHMLERDLQEKMRIQQEGRKREAIARERGMSRQRVEAARSMESKNPMTLAELFRLLLFFVNEELVEEPLPDTPLQFPHLKGEWAENMLSTVYRRYCRSSGYMSLEEFVEFMEDSAVLQTHVPHDENDEPLTEFQAQLDPVRLLTTVPRNLGYSMEMENELAGGGTVASDNFRLNFAQFYQLLMRIAHVVYGDLYAQDASHALNKLLQETILPLYGWCKGHSKRGAMDPLVTEERIVLLLSLYAPNLWKVFLMYCQDHQAKVPELNLAFPDSAKGSERVLFGVPYGAPFNRKKTDGTEDVGYFMTETACIRFCQDYGLTPHLVTRGQLKETLQGLNRVKSLFSQRKAKEQHPPTVFYQKTHTTLVREATSQTFHQSVYEPMHFSGAEQSREVVSERCMGGMGKRVNHMPMRLSNPAAVVKEHGGLGFSEFVELIARIAVDGMQAESYHVLFPTPFSKVLAILTVWGVADLRKIEEVRLIRSENM